MDVDNHIEKKIDGLNRLSRNLWWTWNQDAQDLFEDLSPRAWQNLYHNAVAVLHELSDQELSARLRDTELSDRVESVLLQFENYLDDSDTWAVSNAKDLTEKIRYKNRYIKVFLIIPLTFPLG